MIFPLLTPDAACNSVSTPGMSPIDITLDSLARGMEQWGVTYRAFPEYFRMHTDTWKQVRRLMALQTGQPEHIFAQSPVLGYRGFRFRGFEVRLDDTVPVGEVHPPQKYVEDCLAEVSVMLRTPIYGFAYPTPWFEG